MSFRDYARKGLDIARGVMGRASLDLRQFTIARVTKTWASGTVGHGAVVTTESALTCDGNPPRVREASEDEIRHLLGSGSLFKPGMYVVGPLTPEFAGGGYALSGFDAASGAATQVLYRVEGDGMPSGGRLYRAAKLDTSHPLRITLVLEPAANAPAR